MHQCITLNVLKWRLIFFDNIVWYQIWVNGQGLFADDTNNRKKKNETKEQPTIWSCHFRKHTAPEIRLVFLGNIYGGRPTNVSPTGKFYNTGHRSMADKPLLRVRRCKRAKPVTSNGCAISLRLCSFVFSLPNSCYQLETPWQDVQMKKQKRHSPIFTDRRIVWNVGFLPNKDTITLLLPTSAWSSVMICSGVCSKCNLLIFACQHSWGMEWTQKTA